jgi:hypothetical protein
MIQFIKSLLKIKLKEDCFFLGFMTQMNIFIGPSQTILNSSRFDKAILVLMNKLHDDSMHPICQELCDKLECTVEGK